MHRNFKYRIRPTKVQQAALTDMLADFCTLYNAALEQRISAYQRQSKSITFYDQSAELTSVRAEIEGLDRWSFTGEVQVLRRLDQTYRAFFRRGHGFPRFRSRARFDSANMRVGHGLAIRRNKRLTLVGVPGQIKVVWHRELVGKLGRAIISRSCGKWYVCFLVETDGGSVADRAYTPIGIDLGLHSLIANSDGLLVEAPRYGREASRRLRLHQRALSRCKRGSARRRKFKARFTSASAKVANQRRDFSHKLSASLVAENSHIAFENLNIVGMSRGILAKSIHDAAWAQLVQFTTYKAECAGSVVELVDPRYTSQTCPDCGTVKAKPLSLRHHNCECGCSLDRDVAAAKVILARANFSMERAVGRQASGVPHSLSEEPKARADGVFTLRQPEGGRRASI